MFNTKNSQQRAHSASSPLPNIPPTSVLNGGGHALLTARRTFTLAPRKSSPYEGPPIRTWQQSPIEIRIWWASSGTLLPVKAHLSLVGSLQALVPDEAHLLSIVDKAILTKRVSAYF